MNILIGILIGIAGLIGLLLLVAAFAKKGYTIRREIVVDRPVATVFDYLRHIKNQDLFSVWVMKDPAMAKKFTGTDGTVGFIYGWNGNKDAGEGEQEIMALEDGKRIEIEVRFKRPFEAVAQTPFTTEPAGEGKTRVSWTMISTMKYPMNIMLVFMDMDKLLGKDMETSLGTLKGLLEK